MNLCRCGSTQLSVSCASKAVMALVRSGLPAKRILHAFVARGLLEKTDAKEMLAYQHSGFSVDSVDIRYTPQAL